MNTGFLGPAVATVLTACGIETAPNPVPITAPLGCNSTYRLRYWNLHQIAKDIIILQIVATVLTACGIETDKRAKKADEFRSVATVLTACGIETKKKDKKKKKAKKELQQYLPLAVLKQSK